MPITVWLSFLALALLLVFPLLFGELMLAGLGKLHVSSEGAALLMVSIILGGFINIPIRRYVRHEEVIMHPLAVFGLSGYWPQLRRVRRETIIAVNVGGCLIPTALALYELVHLAESAWPILAVTALACTLNAFVCYLVARPVPGIGIVMPGFVSPIVAAGLAVLLAPDQAAPVAYVAGVAGPLIGADLLHLGDIRKTAVGLASIGGAGTFDGIVLSGIVAAYLA